jgi:hypothetical protein
MFNCFVSSYTRAVAGTAVCDSEFKVFDISFANYVER